jgi:hypothetical protein
MVLSSQLRYYVCSKNVTFFYNELYSSWFCHPNCDITSVPKPLFFLQENCIVRGFVIPTAILRLFQKRYFFTMNCIVRGFVIQTVILRLFQKRYFFTKKIV